MALLGKIKERLKDKHILNPRCRFLLGMRCKGMLLLAPDVHYRYVQMPTKVYFSKRRLYFEEVIPGSGGKGSGRFLHSAPIKSIENMEHNMIRLKTGLSSYVVGVL